MFLSMFGKLTFYKFLFIYHITSNCSLIYFFLAFVDVLRKTQVDNICKQEVTERQFRHELGIVISGAKD